MENIIEKLSPEEKKTIVSKAMERLNTDSFSQRLITELKKNKYETDNAFEYLQWTTKTAQDITCVFNQSEYEAIIAYLHNANFRETHLKDGNKLKSLIVHKPLNAEEKRASDGILKYIPKHIVGEIVRVFIEQRFNPNIMPLSPQEKEKLQESILNIQKGKDTLILTNHDTFGNIPMIIITYMQIAHQMGIKNINQHISTILGPLLMTHKWEKMLIDMLSNIIITQPIENNPVELEKINEKQRKKASHKMINKGETGKILICAPSATRDILIKKKDGSTLIYIPGDDQRSIEQTLRLANLQQRQGANILLIGTNTTDFKAGVNPSNNTRKRKASIELHLKDVSENIKQLSDEKQYTETLASLVQENQRCIAKPIPYKQFIEIKKLQKSDQLGAYLDENGEVNLQKIQEKLLLETQR